MRNWLNRAHSPKTWREHSFKKMEDECEEDCLLALALVIILRRRRRRRRKQNIKPRRFWIRDILRRRKASGEFHNLVREL